MAISAPHYRCLRELYHRKQLPQGGSILEIGEASWYGDISAEQVMADWKAAGSPVLCSYLNDDEWQAYKVVKAVYATLFHAEEVASIDFHGTPAAIALDMNEGIVIDGNFETVINHGTAEHIFNVAQVFRTMHEHCAVNGLMIHESPLTGWFDHGFWNIQPTVYYDLALANDYTINYMAVTHIDHNSAVEIQSRDQFRKMAANGGIPNNAMLFVALRKQSGCEFKIPMQGLYSEGVDQGTVKAWKELR